MSILDNEGHDPNGLGNRPLRSEVEQLRAALAQAERSRDSWIDVNAEAGKALTAMQAEIERLLDLIRRSADMIDDAYSGYIPWSGSDQGWDKGKERLLADLCAARDREYGQNTG